VFPWFEGAADLDTACLEAAGLEGVARVLEQVTDFSGQQLAASPATLGVQQVHEAGAERQASHESFSCGHVVSVVELGAWS
jgi:hypothetical protein